MITFPIAFDKAIETGLRIRALLVPPELIRRHSRLGGHPYGLETEMASEQTVRGGGQSRVGCSRQGLSKHPGQAQRL